MSEQTPGQRISQLIAHLGISKNAFASSLGKTATVIQHLVDERNKPGFDLLNKIFEVYPYVSTDWLMQGKGSMLKDSAPTTLSEAKASGQVISEEKPAAPEPARPIVASVVAPEPVAVSTEHATSSPTPTPAEILATAPIAAPFVAPSVTAPAMSAFAPVSPIPTPVPAPAAPVVDPTASLQAALYAQQLTHQLALAEMRNQHLQEQQRMMQQMMEMMQRQLNR